MRLKCRVQTGLSVIITLLVLAGCSSKHSFQGSWTGSVTGAATKGGPSVTFPLVINVKQNKDGTYTASLDSPQQNERGIPLDSFAAEGDAITMKLNVAQAVFNGTANADGTEITGDWLQGSVKASLTMKKAPVK